MKDPTFVIEQLDEALEERGGSDRRKKDICSQRPSGEERRKGDRRQDESDQD